MLKTTILLLAPVLLAASPNTTTTAATTQASAMSITFQNSSHRTQRVSRTLVLDPERELVLTVAVPARSRLLLMIDRPSARDPRGGGGRHTYFFEDEI